VPDFVSLLARVVGALIYALITGWKLTLVFLSISPFIVILFNVTVKVRIPKISFNKFSMNGIVIQVIMKYTIKEIQAFASASSIAQEVLQNIRTVTAFHGQTKEEERSRRNFS
jgi:ABC-type multidrug transport system fused ATPase/permease subunit